MFCPNIVTTTKIIKDKIAAASNLPLLSTSNLLTFNTNLLNNEINIAIKKKSAEFQLLCKTAILTAQTQRSKNY